MALSLMLRLYLFAARRRFDPASAAIHIATEPAVPDRPRGPLVWLDAADPKEEAGMAELARRIRIARPAVSVLLTGAARRPEHEAPEMIRRQTPPDTLDAVTQFMEHWRPDLGILSGGNLRPALLHGAKSKGVPLMLIAATRPRIAGKGWWPGLSRNCLRMFDHVLALDKESFQALARAGGVRDRLMLGGPLEEPSYAFDHNEAERMAIARLLGTRPVWLAVGVPAKEDQAIAEAHLVALRAAHRLLLIVVPDNPSRGAALAETVTGIDGLAVALRSVDAEIEDDTQIYIADTEGELGLWYRIAPVVYFGGTLSGDARPRHPFEATAHGCAILRGPDLSQADAAAHTNWTRLAAAGAVQIVTDPAQLGEAVGTLLAPDHAARMARAAWEISSSGGAATDQALSLALDLLDRLPDRHD